MKASSLTILVPLAAAPALVVHADAPGTPRPLQPDVFAAPAPQRAAQAPGARPSDDAIKAAVRAVLEEMPVSPMPSSGTALSGSAYRSFERRFSAAKKPHCLGPDPLKHQPHSFVAKTVLGDYVFGVGGIFALPFWSAAIVRGKCNWTR